MNIFIKKSHRNRDSIFEGNARLTVNGSRRRQLNEKLRKVVDQATTKHTTRYNDYHIFNSIDKNEIEQPKNNNNKKKEKKMKKKAVQPLTNEQLLATTIAGICLYSSVHYLN